jgi:hypothetical protein
VTLSFQRRRPDGCSLDRMPAPRLVKALPDPLPSRSDDELMTLAQAGVREAFGVLVERHEWDWLPVRVIPGLSRLRLPARP